jgi:HAD superfamily hydrolase (TIGR01509 family)
MADRPGLDAVLLDAGGTLLRLDFEWMAATVTALGAPRDAAALRRAEVEGRRCYDRSRVRGPAPDAPEPPLGAAGEVRAYFGGTLEAAGVPAEVIVPAFERFRERQAGPGLWTRPMEGARAALDELGSLGLRCAVVSNSDGRAETHLRDCDMLRGLEFVVDSALVGVEKPDPRIFRIALDRLGVPASRALFVGDIRSVDEAGAAAAGTHFVLLDPLGDYAAKGAAAVPGMERLVGWVRERFAVTTQSAPGREGGRR